MSATGRQEQETEPNATASVGDQIRQEYRRTMAAFRFEMRRTMTPSRFSAWVILVLFPSIIMGIFRYNQPELPESAWGVALYLLATQAITLLGLLLWVAPAIQVELEGGSWSYVAVRPGGKISVVFGKYLNGVVWTMTAGAAGLSLAMLVAWPPVTSRWELYGILFALQFLGTISYGALYLLIGVMFPRRAMVIAVAYTLVFEVVVSLVPANINQLTVQHRLWNLLWSWTKWAQVPQIQLTLDDLSPGMHLIILVLYAAALLAISAVAVRKSEYLVATTEV